MDYGISDFIGLSKNGLKKEAFSLNLKKEDLSFLEIQSSLKGKNKIPFFKANLDQLKDFFSIRDIRRIDGYGRIVLLLSAGLLKNIDINTKENLGVVLGTAFGSFKTNCDFLDSIILQGFDAASPMFFTGTVHNSPLAPLGMFLGLKGPAYCISNFENTFNSSFHISNILLSSKICEKVLLIFADEISPLLLYGLGNIYNIDEENLKSIPQEGGCAFLLSSEKNILPIKEIKNFLNGKEKNEENYGFTYYPEAFELLINLDKNDLINK